MNEVCPVTKEECAVLTAAQNLKPVEYSGSASQAEFDEKHSEIISQAQNTYCTPGSCGLTLMGIATVINTVAESMSIKEPSDVGVQKAQ